MSTTHKRPICWMKRNQRRISPVFNLGQISPPNMGPGVLTGLINSLDKPWVIDRDEFRPIMNHNKYIAMLEAQGKHPPELLEKMRLDHENYYATHCAFGEMRVHPGPKLPKSLINTESEINGCQAFIEFNKVKDPQDTIPMYVNAGVKEECIKYLEKRILNWKCGISERNRSVDEILSKYSGKPQARKKKKSLRSRFKNTTKSLIKEGELDDDKDDPPDA